MEYQRMPSRAVAFNDRNPYMNVISFIVPIDAISKVLVDVLKN